MKTREWDKDGETVLAYGGRTSGWRLIVWRSPYGPADQAAQVTLKVEDSWQSGDNCDRSAHCDLNLQDIRDLRDQCTAAVLELGGELADLQPIERLRAVRECAGLVRQRAKTFDELIGFSKKTAEETLALLREFLRKELIDSMELLAEALGEPFPQTPAWLEERRGS